MYALFTVLYTSGSCDGLGEDRESVVDTITEATLLYLQCDVRDGAIGMNIWADAMLVILLSLFVSFSVSTVCDCAHSDGYGVDCMVGNAQPVEKRHTLSPHAIEAKQRIVLHKQR